MTTDDKDSIPKEAPKLVKLESIHHQLKEKVKIQGVDYLVYPESLPEETLTQQTLYVFGLAFWLTSLLFFLLVCPFGLVYAGLFIPWTRPLVFGYIAWMIYDSKTPIYGRQSPFFLKYVRYNQLWEYFSGYFKGQLVKTAELDPTRKYIIGYHPHGVYALALFVNIVFCNRFVKAFQGINALACTLPVNFWFPIWRDYALLLGSGSCESRSLKHRLKYGKPGTAMIIALGGAEEFKHMKEGTMDLVLKKRKGFIKIALTTGVDLVPVIGFGENEIFKRITHPFFQPLHKLFHFIFKSSAPLFMGKTWFGFPARHPLVTVVGSAIRVEKIQYPSKQQIDELHEKYMQSLQKLYDDYKDIYHTHRTQEMRFVK